MGRSRPRPSQVQVWLASVGGTSNQSWRVMARPPRARTVSPLAGAVQDLLGPDPRVPVSESSREGLIGRDALPTDGRITQRGCGDRKFYFKPANEGK